MEPQNAEKLPAMAKKLRQEYGVSILSVASSTEENIFAACAGRLIPIIESWLVLTRHWDMGTEKRKKQEFEKLVLLCEKYGVKIGFNHFGYMTANSMEMLHLVENFDPKYIGVIWDAGHSGLAGEERAGIGHCLVAPLHG